MPRRERRTVGWVLALACLSLGSLARAVAAETVWLEPSADATLIEDDRGDWANGSGPSLFAGRTSQSQVGVRRALLRFDVVTLLPDGAIIEDVALHLHLLPSNPEPRVLRLHRALAAWGEGPSSASGGGGAPSGPGDTTWLHATRGQELWTQSGGQFAGHASASQVIGPAGSYVWQHNRRLVDDVRRWQQHPRRNHGWMLIGDESRPQTAKSFASREHGDPALWPRLEVRYTLADLDDEDDDEEGD